MKRIITLLTAALLVCLLLAGCTPKDAKPTENGSTPSLETGYIPSPEGTAAPDSAGMSDGEEGKENLSAPEPVGEDLSPEELEELLSETEAEGGLEVEDDYEVEIGENVGVGGN